MSWMDMGTVPIDPGLTPPPGPPTMSEMEARAFMTSDAAYTHTPPFDYNTISHEAAARPSRMLPEDTATAAKKLSKDMFMGLAAGAIVGTVLVSGLLMNQGMIVKTSMSKKSIAVRSSAVGAAVAVPLVAYYMQRWN